MKNRREFMGDSAKIATLDANKTLFIDHCDYECIKWLANYKA